MVPEVNFLKKVSFFPKSCPLASKSDQIVHAGILQRKRYAGTTC